MCRSDELIRSRSDAGPFSSREKVAEVEAIFAPSLSIHFVPAGVAESQPKVKPT
jgi:hypothetical protein